MTLTNLFAESNNTATTNGRGLAGTAQLTAVANEAASRSIRLMNDDVETYKEMLVASQHDNKAMDELLEVLAAYEDIDTEFITQLDDSVIDGMLKSQQSKRSRAKSKAMTMDNYKSLMSAAIAENLIRKATGRTKNSVGVRRGSGSVTFTEEYLEQLKDDQEKLKKELRNVQSKKSIMKSKAGFDPESERWQELLVAEEQLKSIRVTTRGTTKVVEVDTTKKELEEAFDGINLEDIKQMKAADSKALLEKLAGLLSK